MNKKSPRSATTEVLKEPVTLTFTPITAIMVIVAFLAGVGIGYLAWGRSPAGSNANQAAVKTPATTQPATQQAAAQSTQSKPTRYDVPEDGDPSLGPANAPITIIEFSDYQ